MPDRLTDAMVDLLARKQNELRAIAPHEELDEKLITSDFLYFARRLAP